MDREKQTAITEQDYLKALQKNFSQKYCLNPDAGPTSCKGNIVRAHTIQRSGGLSRIAWDGHVYHFLPPPTAAIKPTPPAARLIGIKEASTFTGFCGYHDATTFAPIETNPFVSSQEHAFLLAYRVFLKEIFLKRADLASMSIRRELDKGQSIYNQRTLQQATDWYESGVKASIRDLEHYRQAYDAALMNADYNEVSYYVVNLDRTPDVMVSGLMSPEYNFDGSKLQELYDLETIQDMLSFSIIATDTGGAAVFSWLGKSEASRRLVATLHTMTDDEIPHALMRFTFEHFENTFASPDWWESLDTTAQNKLLHRIYSGTATQEREPDCLTNDRLRVVNWNVVSRETNITF